MVSAPRSLNTCPCVRVRGVIKSVITFFITVWSGGTPAEDSGLLTMVVQTTAQILGCSLAAASSALPSCIQAEKTLRMFSDLSDRAYLYHSLCSSGRAPRTIRTWICRISKQHLSRGGVECNGPGRHTLQAIYSTHWFYFSIDCFFFYFKTGCLFFLLQYVYLSCLSWLIGEFTAIICSGYFIGRIWCTSVYTATCESYKTSCKAFFSNLCPCRGLPTLRHWKFIFTGMYKCERQFITQSKVMRWLAIS